MKTLITAIILSVCSIQAFAQQQASPASVATHVSATSGVLDFKSETIDYGVIQKNSNGERFFEFTNTGHTPIVISRVKASCGCTVPTKPKEPILPGETAQISVKYDTKRIGAFSKTITIISNASESTKMVKIKGKVTE